MDGTGLTAADTEENQEKWPQQKQQKPGCGFPRLRVCACFSLRTGGVLSYRTGNKKSLFHDQRDDLFDEGDINLAAKRKPSKTADAFKALGDNDLLVV